MMHFLVYYFQQHSVRLLTYSLQRWRSLLLGRQPKRGLLHQLIFRFAKLDCPTQVCQGRYNTIFERFSAYIFPKMLILA